MSATSPAPLAIKAALAQLRAQGLEFSDCIREFGTSYKDSSDDGAYVRQAQKSASDGDLEIDEPAVVSRGDDSGAYVMAWLWVADRDIWQGKLDSDGDPCRVVNYYQCERCDTEWSEQWSCACNDHCPSCDREIEPESSFTLALDGHTELPE